MSVDAIRSALAEIYEGRGEGDSLVDYALYDAAISAALKVAQAALESADGNTPVDRMVHAMFGAQLAAIADALHVWVWA